MYFLAKYPEWQQKLLNELNSVTPDRVPKMSDALPWMDAFIKESMRMAPPVGILPNRVTAEDVIVPIPGNHLKKELVLKKGTRVMMSIYGLQYNPRSFSNPNQFDPERFIRQPEQDNSTRFYGFGGGIRICKFIFRWFQQCIYTCFRSRHEFFVA